MTASNRSMRARNLVVVGGILFALGIAVLIWGLVGDSEDAVNFGAGTLFGSGLAVLVGLWMGRRTEPGA